MFCDGRQLLEYIHEVVLNIIPDMAILLPKFWQTVIEIEVMEEFFVAEITIATMSSCTNARSRAANVVLTDGESEQRAGKPVIVDNG